MRSYIYIGLLIILIAGCMPMKSSLVSPSDEMPISKAELENLSKMLKFFDSSSLEGDIWRDEQPVYSLYKGDAWRRCVGETKSAKKLEWGVSRKNCMYSGMLEGLSPQSEDTLRQELNRAMGIAFLPVEYNPQVDNFIEQFSVGGRQDFRRYLNRAPKYFDLVKQILKEHGLPEELAYLPYIESGYNPYAYSRAGAAGLWQFIAPTGRRYGLRIDWWIDERRDPIKSTHAAANYLTDLYDRFGSWYLALAAFNAGEGRIEKAVRQSGTDDFWKISSKRYLKLETREYVPKFLTALIIARNPEAYGFDDLKPSSPLKFEQLTIKEAIDLRVISRMSGVDIETLRRLNPELRRFTTPVGYKNYRLNVPVGSREKIARAIASLTPDQRFSYKRHVVKMGETLSSIAAVYGAKTKDLIKLNEISNPRRLRVGQSLLVPVSKSAKAAVNVAGVAAESSQKGLFSHQNLPMYRVRRGDSLHLIAGYMGSSVEAICLVNDLNLHEELIPGKDIRIPLNHNADNDNAPDPASLGMWRYDYTVKPGDSVWQISRREGVHFASILNWNKIEPGHVLKPGDILRIVSRDRNSVERVSINDN